MHRGESARLTNPPSIKMPKLRVATLQLNPRIPTIDDNIARANHILSLAFPKSRSPDVLVLPEMALCGYNYKSAKQITPLLESVENPGPMLKWGQEISKRLHCFTVMGYPEWCAQKEQIFNSAVVFNRLGQVVHNYRKSFLYETDEVWGCAEGPGFHAFEMMEGVKASLGICMDLNPYKFQAPFSAFEFSSHCLKENVNLVICPMNWLHGHSPSIENSLDSEQKLVLARAFQKQIDQVQGDYAVNAEGANIQDYEEKLDYEDLHTPDFHNLNYWILRFFPFMNHPMKLLSSFQGKSTVVFCNRSGLEDTILYGGTSSIVQFNGSTGVSGYQSTDLTNKSVDVLAALGKGDEGILIRDVDV